MDDDTRFVELIMDNLLWGNVKFNWDKIIDSEKYKNLGKKMGDFFRLHQAEPDGEEIKKLTEQLARDFKVLRVMDYVIGELRDRVEENTIKKLQQDNEELAKHLDKAYIPAMDTKVGTN